MRRLEYFSKVIKVVTELMEVSEKEIIGGCKTVEAVDARWLTIKLMRDKGYSTNQIAPLVGSAKRSVTHALCYFEYRAETPISSLGNNYAIAKQILGNT